MLLNIYYLNIIVYNMALKNKQRILNLGCGSDTYGTDFADLYPSRDNIIKCNIETEQLPYADSTFDIIIAHGLLQHITNLPNFFNECKRTLKKGGTLDILVANAGFWGIFGSTFYGKYDSSIKKKGMTEGKAYLLFTPTSIKNILHQYGFRDVRCSYQIASTNKKNNPYHIVAINAATLLNRRLNPHIRVTAKK